MSDKNLLVISNSFPNSKSTFVGDIFVKEQLKYLRCYFNHVYVISPVAYGMEYIRKAEFSDYSYDNISVIFPKYFNIPSCYSKFRDIWAMLEASAIIRRIKKENISFDLIHAHFTWPSGAVAIKLKQEFKVPVIITEHTHTTLYNELKNQDWHYLSTWKDCDAIIRVNKKDIPLFTGAGVPETKMFHIANGYDPKKYSFVPALDARSHLGIGRNKKIILNISRLYEEKGQKYLIEAMDTIVKTHPEIVCYIGGSGPLKEKLQQQINTLNLDKNVKMIGFVPDDIISLWMNACDFFVLPSLSEGNPTVMFEALGCGKPFVGTTVGGVPEVITSDAYGLLVEPADPDDLAEKILLALDREWDRGAILAYAEHFTWENIAKEIMGVYTKVLGKY